MDPVDKGELPGVWPGQGGGDRGSTCGVVQVGGGGSKGVGLEECERTLERLLSECGMGDVMGC